jgi:hypothetical protein
MVIFMNGEEKVDSIFELLRILLVKHGKTTDEIIDAINEDSNLTIHQKVYAGFMLGIRLKED